MIAGIVALPIPAMSKRGIKENIDRVYVRK